MDATSDKASTIGRDQKTGINPEILKTGNKGDRNNDLERARATLAVVKPIASRPAGIDRDGQPKFGPGPMC